MKISITRSCKYNQREKMWDNKGAYMTKWNQKEEIFNVW